MSKNLSCDVTMAKPYKEKFKNIIKEMDVGPDQYFNAEKSSQKLNNL